MIRILAPVLPAIFLAAAAAAHAGPLMNGNFGSFAGWEGVITDSGSLAPETVDPAADGHFELVGGGSAELTNDLDYYEVVLSQAFDLDATAITLSFAFDWTLTAGDPGNPDFVQATLYKADLSDYIDLFPLTLDTGASSASGSAATNVGAFAGQAVILEFLLQDGDFDEIDRLRIGVIEIKTADAPAPNTWILMLTGLFLRRACRRAE